jgi:hypothetical protein
VDYNKLKWVVNIKGYPKGDKKVIIDIRNQLDIFTDAYNTLQKKKGEVNLLVDKSKDFPSSDILAFCEIKIPDFKYLYNNSQPYNMIRLLINHTGQITGILEINRQDTKDFFYWLHDQFESYSPTINVDTTKS